MSTRYPACGRSDHRLLEPGASLVGGFFAGDGEVAAFDHAVTTAWRWPVEVLVERLAGAGLAELERRQWESPDRPDRRYAAVAARAV